MHTEAAARASWREQARRKASAAAIRSRELPGHARRTVPMIVSRTRTLRRPAFLPAVAIAVTIAAISMAATNKPPLHAKKWMAITGKPLAATAGAMIFQKGGNAVDAACAMIAATCTMWDTLSWGGETQALIYDPHAKRVVGVNGLGVAPGEATVARYRAQGLRYPPEYGPLAAITPGTP